MFSESDWRFFIGVLIAGGVAIGFALFVVLPWLWDLAKPWLHMITG